MHWLSWELPLEWWFGIRWWQDIYRLVFTSDKITIFGGWNNWSRLILLIFSTTSKYFRNFLMFTSLLVIWECENVTQNLISIDNYPVKYSYFQMFVYSKEIKWTYSYIAYISQYSYNLSNWFWSIDRLSNALLGH